jgi:hypothetical protein
VHEWGPLGEVLRGNAAPRDQANVVELAEWARELLKLVRETFPDYTMHDERHAENVIALMGELAAPRLSQMSGLEAALLILAAYFHDTGMVYSAAEIAEIPQESEFRDFLAHHDEAYLETERNDGRPTGGVIESYCRSRHADRVRVILERCDRDKLKWAGRPLRDALELICRSHNLPASDLHDPRFKTDFLYAADLRFCSVLLRLADILDLDDTRSPAVIYDHLALASRDAAVSDREWKKHLAARGFVFPPSPAPNYSLQFVAEPTEPGVEHDLRVFLGVIKDELSQCRQLIDVCHDRWRGMPLPASIDTSAITSEGYKYGEFRFELDRTAVLALFTGNQLYDTPYAFLRELLQNSIDAVVTRKHLYGHESTGVHVSCWEDEDGFLWVRVDDDGIGMDEQGIRDYLLRVGRSYYRSPEFEAELTRRGLDDHPFGVISQFGIGILSCFMVGDQVELSTRRAGAKAVRLSINHRDDYFVLQESGRSGREMPAAQGAEPAFLSSPGTHIAVRIDANRVAVDLDEVARRVRRYTFAPPVDITINGQVASRQTTTLAEMTSLERPVDTTVAITWRDEALRLGLRLPHQARIVAIPLDLGATGVSRDLQGQMVVTIALPAAVPPQETGDGDLDDALRRILPTTYFSFLSGFEDHHHRSEFKIAGIVHVEEELALSLLPTLAKRPESSALTAFIQQSEENQHHFLMSEFSSFILSGSTLLSSGRTCGRWSYNGISLPNDALSKVFGTTLGDIAADGAIALTGTLRPELNVSRTGLRTVAFPLQSALQLALRKAIHDTPPIAPEAEGALDRLSRATLFSVGPGEPYTVAGLREDQLLYNGAWNGERVIRRADSPKLTSINEIHALVTTAGPLQVEVPFPDGYDEFPDFDFYEVLVTGLVALFLDVAWSPLGRGPRYLTVVAKQPPAMSEGSELLPPMFAVPFEQETEPAKAGPYLNATHPLTRWILRHGKTIAADIPVVFRQVFFRANEMGMPADQMNEGLSRVARTRPDIAPPPEAYVREDENGWWWSR